MNFFVVAGQAMIGIVFLSGIVTDITGRQKLLGLLEAKRIPYAKYLLPGAIGLKIVCSLGLIFNYWVSIAAFFLAGFTLIANVIFHPFWICPANDRKREYFAFMVHMAVIGGLMVIVGK